MENRTRFIKIMSVSLASVICITLLSIMVADNFFCIKNVTYSIDPYASSACCSLITSVVDVSVQKGVGNLEAFAAEIKSSCEAIHRVIAEQRPDGKLQVSVELHPLLAHVNNTLVLTERGVLTTHAWYEKSLVSALPNLYFSRCTDSDFVVPSAALQACYWLTDTVLNRYDIVWHDDNRILLQDKTWAPFSIACDPSCPLQKTTIGVCEKILAGLQKRVRFSEGDRHKRWVADVRFKDQIVVKEYE